ncbi:lbe protein [Trichoderma arundinaceum]|uniref:Lbe protein n=1 Tax=Trichoderma arundinaceum TaxID=490622 RepID=A0A395NAJ8_TRIAR|nr:lbe protein [Trichoderma arundinaceum]
MPTYLCHGFRWTRRLIRIFVILEDLEDAAPDWITGRDTSAIILERFSTKFDYLPQRPAQQPSEQQSEPQSEHQQEQAKQEEKTIAHQDDDLSVPPSRVPDCEDSVLINQASPVKLLEEHDPEETSISTRPFAYVADHVIRIDLSANILEEIAKYEALAKERNEGDWFEKLRDELQAGAPIEWYVVVNGDEERGVPQYDDEDSIESDMRELGVEEENEPKREQQTAGSAQPRNRDRLHAPSKSVDQPHSLRHKISRAGLRRLFSKKEASE